MRPLLREQGQLIGEKQCDAPVALTDGFNAGPCHFAGGNQRVQSRRIVLRNARGQNERLEQ